jgi:NADH-quinone oxidoreductase subunit M
VFGFWTFDYFALRDIMLPLRPQMFAFAAFTLAFAIKVPMFPLHTWLPDAHVEAPTAGSVILAGVLLKMGTYGYLRFSMGLFPHAAWKAGPTIAALAVVGILYGALTAWRQRDIKRLVAYSSVSHLGFVMLGLASAEPRAMAGAVLAMVNHGVSTGALFLLVGIVYERRHTRMMDDFGGLASVMPMFATVFVIVTLSSIGLPGTNGFVGEFFVLLGTFQSDFLPRAHWLVAFAGLGIVLGAVYMLGMVMRVFFGPVRDPRNEGLPDIGGREIATLAPLVALVFVIGLFPGFFTRRMGDSVRSAAVSFVQRVEQEDYLTRQGSLDEPRSFRRWMGERAGVLDATARFGGGGDTRPYDARTGPGEAAAAGPPVFRPSEPAAAGGAP